MLAGRTVWHPKNTILTVKHGGWQPHVLGLVLCKTNWTINYYWREDKWSYISGDFGENLRPSLRGLKMERGWIFQHDSDPKHTVARATKEWLQKRKVLEQSSQTCPQSNFFAKSWKSRFDQNLTDLGKICVEEWAKPLPQFLSGRAYKITGCFITYFPHC